MIRLVHLSDLHIGPRPINSGPVMPGLAEADANALSALAGSASIYAVDNVAVKRAEHTQCIVSGDLSANGSDIEILTALTFVRAQLALTLSNDDLVGLRYNRNVHFILGNHDVWGGAHPVAALIRTRWRKRKAHNMLWQNYPTPWNVAPDRPPVTAVDSDGLRVRVYLLDSTWTGLRNLLARGRVPRAQLDRLKVIVERDQENDRIDAAIHTALSVAVVHHPIVSPDRHRVLMLLENAEELRNCLQTLGFGMVLCGHEHKHAITDLGGGLLQCLGGTACQASAAGENEFYVYDLSVDRAGGDDRRVLLQAHEFTRSAHGQQPFTQAAAYSCLHPRFTKIRPVP